MMTKSEYNKQYYEANKERLRRAAREREKKKRAENPELVNQKKREQRAKNLDLYRETRKKWNKQNPLKVKQHEDKRYRKDREKRLKANKVWVKNNTSRVREKARERHNRYIRNLDDWYIKIKLKRQGANDIDAYMISVKKKSIKLKRLIDEKRGKNASRLRSDA